MKALDVRAILDGQLAAALVTFRYATDDRALADALVAVRTITAISHALDDAEGRPRRDAFVDRAVSRYVIDPQTDVDVFTALSQLYGVGRLTIAAMTAVGTATPKTSVDRETNLRDAADMARWMRRVQEHVDTRRGPTWQTLESLDNEDPWHGPLALPATLRHAVDVEATALSVIWRANGIDVRHTPGDWTV